MTCIRTARLALLLAGLGAVAVAVAGAGASASATANAADAGSSVVATQPVLELRVLDGALPPGRQLIRATQGDTLRWRVSSNRAGELHLHAYRVSAALQPGKPAALTFRAHAAGRFRLEWHAADAAAAADAGAHHAPPLAVLEVRPR